MKAVLVVDENLSSFAPAIEASACGTGDICFGAVEDTTDTACGVMATEVIPGGIIVISYIYVHPDYRRRGAGSVMISLLKEFASANSIPYLQCRRRLESDNDAVTRFFESVGFAADESDRPLVYSFRVGDLKKTRSPKFDGRVESVSGLTYRAWARCEEMLDMPFPWRSAVDGDLSFIASDATLNPRGILFTSREKDGVRITNFGVEGGDPSVTAEALYEHAIAVARADLPEDVQILAEISDETGAHDLFRLSGDRAVPVGHIECLKIDLGKVDS